MTSLERDNLLFEVECFLRVTSETNPVIALHKFRQLPTYENFSVIPQRPADRPHDAGCAGPGCNGPWGIDSPEACRYERGCACWCHGRLTLDDLRKENEREDESRDRRYSDY